MDVKSELRSARDAIKQKEYKEALKHCKNVLKADKTNYNAFVFIGKCKTELEEYEKARQAYNKAIEQNNESILAWQGLCSLLERAKNNAWDGDLVEVYRKLLKEREGEKYEETVNKLVKLLKELNCYKEVTDVLEEALKKTMGQSNQYNLYLDLVDACKSMIAQCPENEKTENIVKLHSTYKNALLCVNDKPEEEVLVVSYLQFLLDNCFSVPAELPNLSEVFETGKKFQGKFSKNADIASLFTRIFFNHVIGNLEIVMELKDQLSSTAAVLDSASSLHHVIRGCLCFIDKAYSKATEWFKLAHMENFSHATLFYLLISCHHILHQNEETMRYVEICHNALKTLEFVESRKSLEGILDIVQVEILLEQENLNDPQKEMMRKLIHKNSLSNKEDFKALILQVKTHLKLNNVKDALEALKKLEDAPSTLKSRVLELKVEFSLHERKYYDAELRAQEALELEESFRVRFLLGKVYWCLAESNSEYYPKAYTEFLKALKLDINYAQIFYYLGQYQKEFCKDISKAVKCLEKAHVLNKNHVASSALLADLYLQMDMEDKAVKVYESVTTHAKVGEHMWAWVRLGLVYSKMKNHDKAITCFQKALRGDNLVSHHWECLGEAYFEKGSYTSAQKAFTKAVELDPSSMYSKYKIAKVKQLLRMDAEAIRDYEEILRQDSEYVLALLGISETYLHLQKEKLKVVFDGRALEYAQHVINYISRAVEKQPTFSILWKTLADSLLALHVVCESKCRVTLTPILVKVLSLDVEGSISKTVILDVSSRCYMVAVKLKEEIASYWHDLAIATYYHGVYLKGEEAREKIAQSMKVARKALMMDQKNHKYWNTLGVLSGSSGPSEKCCGHVIDDVQNPGLSQHSFIKALELNPQDAQVWANLGMLYMKHDKIKAAHEAFKKAQASDPSLTQAWIGQAMIAETIGNEDAMDLFRHSVELQFHGEGSLAYAQWVCLLLHQIREESILISTTSRSDMSHLPVHVRKIVSNASVAIQKSTERLKDNSFAFNTLGLLLEQEGLLKQAEKAFTSARNLLSSQPTDNQQPEKLRKVLLNQARVLRQLGEHQNAIEIYKVCDLQTASEVCSLALAYYHADKLQKSIEEYKRAFSLSTSDRERSDILSALGMAQYVAKDIETAKSSLFESTQQKDCCEHGIMALASLGLLHGDGKLAMAALIELAKHKQNNSILFQRKKTMLMTSFYKLQNQIKAAKAELLKAVLKYPNDPFFWSQLSRFIMESETKNFELSVHCSKVAMSKDPSKISNRCDALCSLAFPSADNINGLKRSVQRLVNRFPDDAVSWVLLAVIVNAEAAYKQSTNSSVVQLTGLALTKVDETLTGFKNSPSKLPVLDTMEITLYSKLYQWTMQLYVLSNIFYGDITVAQTFCDKILPTIKSDVNVFEDFVFLRGLAIIQETLKKKGDAPIENLRVMAALALKSYFKWKWMALSDIYTKLHMPNAAELCMKHMAEQNKSMEKPYTASLLRCCLLSIKAMQVTDDNTWLEHSKYVIEQIAELCPDTNHLFILFKAIVFYQEGKQKAALKYLHKIASVGGLLGDLVEKLQEMFQGEKT